MWLSKEYVGEPESSEATAALSNQLAKVMVPAIALVTLVYSSHFFFRDFFLQPVIVITCIMLLCAAALPAPIALNLARGLCALCIGYQIEGLVRSRVLSGQASRCMIA